MVDLQVNPLTIPQEFKERYRAPTPLAEIRAIGAVPTDNAQGPEPTEDHGPLAPDFVETAEERANREDREAWDIFEPRLRAWEDADVDMRGAQEFVADID